MLTAKERLNGYAFHIPPEIRRGYGIDKNAPYLAEFYVVGRDTLRTLAVLDINPETTRPIDWHEVNRKGERLGELFGEQEHHAHKQHTSKQPLIPKKLIRKVMKRRMDTEISSAAVEEMTKLVEDLAEILSLASVRGMRGKRLMPYDVGAVRGRLTEKGKKEA